jgi:subtilisin family serine protease
MKKSKRLSSFFVVSFLALAVLSIQCKIEEPNDHDRNNVSRYAADKFEEKEYSKATLEDQFADDRVVIILNKAESFKFKAYTPKDFPEADCRMVTDSTMYGMEIVKQQLEAEKTKNWSKLEERINTGMLMDVDKFKRILDLHLAVKSKENVLKVIKQLEKREDVLYAGPDYFMELCALPDPQPAHLGDQMDALNSIKLPDAWEIVIGNTETLQWNNLKVGVIDSGIQADHPALFDRIDQTLSRDFTTDSTTGIPGGLQDPNGHGTKVAGIIGANGTGVTGACWGVALVSLRVFNAKGNLDDKASRVRYAIDFARKNNIPILNYSGNMFSDYTGFNDVYSAIQQYPGLFVCAAGNNKNDNDADPRYPSNYTINLPNLISVGAITINPQTKAETIAVSPDPGWNSGMPGSNFGAMTVDLFAPGTSIWTTYNNSSYGGLNNSGTSMAAPYVAGVAALVKALHPNMKGAQLKTALRNSVDVSANLTGRCNTGGKINAYKAVNFIMIVGSIDIKLMGSTTIVNGYPLRTVNGTPVGDVLIGRFHLFSNSEWALVERGKLSSLINDFFPWDYPQSIVFGNVPQGIINSITNAGIGTINSGLWLLVPTSINYGIGYWEFSFNFDLGINGVQVVPWGRYYYLEGLFASDQRKIKVRNNSGSL